VKLTEAQRMALEYAVRVTEHGEYDGTTPRRGQHQMFEVLVRRRLLRFVGCGCHIDDMDRECRLYQVTDRGRAALNVARKEPDRE
jgi:hypothetical protein